MMVLAGASLSVTYVCETGHRNFWCSSPKINQKKRKVARINIEMAGYLFLSGMQFKVFKVIFLMMKLYKVWPCMETK